MSGSAHGAVFKCGAVNVIVSYVSNGMSHATNSGGTSVLTTLKMKSNALTKLNVSFNN